MTESKLVELGFSEVVPGFWVGSVFSLNRLYELGRQDESGADSETPHRISHRDPVAPQSANISTSNVKLLSVTDHTDWTYNLDFPGFDVGNVYDEDGEFDDESDYVICEVSI